MKKHHLFLLGVLCFTSSATAAISQYPCTNALYYARSLAGDDEFLVCQSNPDLITILYGALKWHIPEFDFALKTEDITVTKQIAEDGHCHITFDVVPYRFVLRAQNEAKVTELLGNDTLTLYYQQQELKTINLDKRTRVNYLRELDGVKNSCE